MVALTMCGATALARAQVVPAASESITGRLQDALDVGGTLFLVTSDRVLAYDPTASEAHPRGRFRTVVPTGVAYRRAFDGHFYFEQSGSPHLHVFRGFDQPIVTLPKLLRPPLLAGTVGDQACIAGERIEAGPRAGSEERLPRCMLPSELWGPDLRPDSVHVFDGRALLLSVSRGTNTLWSADGVRPPTELLSTPDGLWRPLALADGRVFQTQFGRGAQPAMWKLARGEARLQEVGAFPRPPGSAPLWLAGAWLYAGVTPSNGQELWRTDGTAAGTRQVADIAPGAAGSRPTLLTVYRGAAFVYAEGWEGFEVFRSDGTAAGTTLLKDLNPRGSVLVTKAATAGDRLYIVTREVLYESDGTTAGTRALPLSAEAPGEPERVVAVGDAVYFTARDLRWPRSLFRARGGKIELVAAPIGEKNPVVDGDPSESWIDYEQRTMSDPAGDADGGLVDFTSGEITAKGDVAYVRYTVTDYVDWARVGWRHQVFFDADRDPTTGYRLDGAGATIGAEYALRGGNLLRYVGSGSDERWEGTSTRVTAAHGEHAVELSFDTRALSPSLIGATVLFRGENDGTDDFMR